MESPELSAEVRLQRLQLYVTNYSNLRGCGFYEIIGSS
jgi:hypothetical protein